MMVIAAALVLALIPQAPKKKDVDLVDPLRVDQAIKKGVEYLRTAESPSELEDGGNSDELILWTLLHAQVPPQDPNIQALLQAILEAPLLRTYKVVLQAMCLEELDCVKYQKRIFHCAQFLIDNQCRNGQWSYGNETTLGELPTATPTGARSDVASGPGQVRDFGAAAERTKPKPQARVPVKKQREGPDHGDNSNSQYAALGLRACHEAGILLPKESLERASAWWRKCQESTETKKEDDDEKEEKKGKKPAPPVATGAAAPLPLGWGYGENAGGEVRGSMTAGAIGALVIYDFILGKNWKVDANVSRGLAWLAKNYTVTRNPGEEDWHYYYLYGLERAGMLTGLERFGNHPWYSTGAKFLLDAQKPDGSWKASEQTTWDTCFAILFLRRATRPLADVASIDRYHRTPEK